MIVFVMKFPHMAWGHWVIGRTTLVGTILQIHCVVLLIHFVDGGYNSGLLEIVINSIKSAKEFDFQKEPLRTKILGKTNTTQPHPTSYTLFNILTV